MLTTDTGRGGALSRRADRSRYRWVRNLKLSVATAGVAGMTLAGCGKSPTPAAQPAVTAKAAATASQATVAKAAIAAKAVNAKVAAVAAAAPAAKAAGADGKRAWAATYVQGLVSEVEGDKELAPINASERLYASVAKAVLNPWSAAWEAKDGDAFAKLLAANATGATFASAKVELKRDMDGIRESTLTLADGAKVADDARAYLGSFKKIEAFDLVTRKVSETATGADLVVGYDLRGVTTKGVRLTDRGALNVSVVKAGASWKIAKIGAIAAHRIELAANRAPAFEHATQRLALGDVPILDRKEAIRRGGYAISVTDYDGDRKPDVLLGNFGAVRLYRNTGTGFVDVTEKAGLQKESLVKSSAFVDLDNDGDRDLVLLRFVFDGQDHIGDVVAYENNGDGTFTRRKGFLPKSRKYDRAMPLTLADFDGNGLVDLYLGFPGSRDFTNNLETYKRGKDVSSQGIWFNEGKWKFNEAPSNSKIVANNTVFPHASIATDLDQDGHVDIIVVDDSGRVNPVYRNKGDGTFTDVTQKMNLAAPGWSMGMTTGDFDGDGDLDILTTNVVMSAAQRIVASAGASVAPESTLGRMLKLVRERYRDVLLYRNDGNGKFTEVAEAAGLTNLGDGAGTVEFIDYNHDGKLDVYIPNGLWSGDKKNESLDSYFMRAAVRFQDKYAKSNDVIRKSVFSAPSSDPNPMLTALRNYAGTLAKSTQAPDAKASLSLGGHQRNRLYRNNGDSTFTEVGFLEGADSKADGYVVATADIDGDGRQDLVLRNCDPAPGQSFESVTVLRNVHAKGNSLAVYLRGTLSNRDGLGAVVTATVGKQKLVREIRATAGAVQGEMVAFFGLGDSDQADSVVVRWPNGKKQTFKAVKKGRVVLEEKKELQRLAQL